MPKDEEEATFAPEIVSLHGVTKKQAASGGHMHTEKVTCPGLWGQEDLLKRQGDGVIGRERWECT